MILHTFFFDRKQQQFVKLNIQFVCIRVQRGTESEMQDHISETKVTVPIKRIQRVVLLDLYPHFKERELKQKKLDHPNVFNLVYANKDDKK